MLPIGTTLAGYRIDGVLGQGGMGTVYEATQLSLDRVVALKLLAAHLSNDMAFRARFRREGQVQARLEHPHVVTVYEAGETEQGLFIAMRLVRGRTLKDLINDRELDVPRTLKILAPVAEALDEAHGLGLIHRDIKPQNVLVGRRDHSFLADFGLTKGPTEASLTKTGHFVGTFDYISPEQINGQPASAARDVYSLAGVLYEMPHRDGPVSRSGRGGDPVRARVGAAAAALREPARAAPRARRGDRPGDGEGSGGAPSVGERADRGRRAVVRHPRGVHRGVRPARHRLRSRRRRRARPAARATRHAHRAPRRRARLGRPHRRRSHRARAAPGRAPRPGGPRRRPRGARPRPCRCSAPARSPSSSPAAS